MSTVALLRRTDESERSPEVRESVLFDLPRIERAVREILFALGEDPDRNGLAETPRRVARAKVLGITTDQIGDGTLINYALRLHGIPLRWQSRIESWAPNRQFVDRQTRGPYALWHHTHEFEPDDGGTIIRDRVRYRLPFGALGELLAGWLVRRDLDAVFDYRRRQIQELMR